jgi:hypothetical protein
MKNSDTLRLSTLAVIAGLALGSIGAQSAHDAAFRALGAQPTIPATQVKVGFGEFFKEQAREYFK